MLVMSHRTHCIGCLFLRFCIPRIWLLHFGDCSQFFCPCTLGMCGSFRIACGCFDLWRDVIASVGMMFQATLASRRRNGVFYFAGHMYYTMVCLVPSGVHLCGRHDIGHIVGNCFSGYAPSSSTQLCYNIENASMAWVFCNKCNE